MPTAQQRLSALDYTPDQIAGAIRGQDLIDPSWIKGGQIGNVLQSVGGFIDPQTGLVMRDGQQMMTDDTGAQYQGATGDEQAFAVKLKNGNAGVIKDYQVVDTGRSFNDVQTGLGDWLKPMAVMAMLVAGGQLLANGSVAGPVGGTGTDTLGAGATGPALEAGTGVPPPTGGAGDWFLGPDGTPIPSGAGISATGGIIPAGVPTPPTGGAADWYIGPDGTPIPSGAVITPEGTIVPTGIPAPDGSTLIAPPAPTSNLVTAPPVDIGTPPVAPGPPGTTITPPGTNLDLSGIPDWLKALLTTLPGLYGAYDQTKNSDYLKDLVNNILDKSDPFASQRQQYQAKLAALMNDPSSVKNLPGYQFQFEQGQTALERAMAAQGFTGSTNAAMGLVKYGEDYASNAYNQEYTKLAHLAGADIQPGNLGPAVQAAVGGVNTGNNANAQWGATLTNLVNQLSKP